MFLLQIRYRALGKLKLWLSKTLRYRSSSPCGARISQLADFVIPEQLSIQVEQSAERIPDGIPAAMDLSWSTDALDLLERAEARAREGDWSGFGEALEELRLLLEQLNRDPR